MVCRLPHALPTLLSDEAEGKTGQGIYADGMVEHDGHVGELLKLLDDLDIADDTFVLWTSDNGPMTMNWPDGGMSPFKSEKATNWEGAFRVPFVVRWPSVIKPGTELNSVVSHHDWMPTLYGAITGTDLKSDLLDGKDVGGATYKVHLDGYDLLPYLQGQEEKTPRKEFLYFADDTSLLALRWNDGSSPSRNSVLSLALGTSGEIHSFSYASLLSKICDEMLLNVQWMKLQLTQCGFRRGNSCLCRQACT